MRLKIYNPSKGTYLWPLLRLHTKFQLPSSIWEGGDSEETALFQSQKDKNTNIFPSNLPERLIFDYVVQLLILYRMAQK